MNQGIIAKVAVSIELHVCLTRKPLCPDAYFVCQTPEDLFEAATQHVVQSLASQPDNDRMHSVALSGGSTPQRLFSQLAAEPYRSQVDWSSIRIFWGDEREVPRIMQIAIFGWPRKTC